jgi:hypothetical protein
MCACAQVIPVGQLLPQRLHASTRAHYGGPLQKLEAQKPSRLDVRATLVSSMTPPERVLQRLRFGNRRLLRGRSFLGCNPCVDVAFQDIQRHRPGEKHRVVEFADVEILSDLAARARA